MNINQYKVTQALKLEVYVHHLLAHYFGPEKGAFGPNFTECEVVNAHGDECTCCTRFRRQNSWAISQKNGARQMEFIQVKNKTIYENDVAAIMATNRLPSCPFSMT